MHAETVVDGIAFGEGPAWCDDGTLAVTSVAEGALYQVWPQRLRKQRLAITGGGANAAATIAGGGFLVTQNGGIDFAATGHPAFSHLPAPDWRTPAIQRVRADGEVSNLTTAPELGGLNAPNDLVVGEDGVLYFTDPGPHIRGDSPIGRVIALAPDGKARVFAEGFWYCNGIALDRWGQLVVIEDKGLQRIFPDGSREWLVEDLGPGGGDGFCVDADGRFYIAATTAHGIRVLDSDGTALEFLPIPGEGLTTNCCFGGEDGRTLFVTDALPGHLVAFEHMPSPGRPVYAWHPDTT